MLRKFLWTGIDSLHASVFHRCHNPLHTQLHSIKVVVVITDSYVYVVCVWLCVCVCVHVWHSTSCDLLGIVSIDRESTFLGVQGALRRSDPFIDQCCRPSEPPVSSCRCEHRCVYKEDACIRIQLNHPHSQIGHAIWIHNTRATYVWQIHSNTAWLSIILPHLGMCLVM